MSFEIELGFLWDVFEKCNLQVRFLEPSIPPQEELDLGLRKGLGIRPDYERIRVLFGQMLHPGTLYRVTDSFLCSYLFLRLPDREEKPMLCVGPYLAVDLTREQLLEQAQSIGVPADRMGWLESYYGRVPLVPQTVIFAPMEVLCQRIWGKDGYTVVDVNQELSQAESFPPGGQRRNSPEETDRRMRQMEERYAYENELLRTVSMGLGQQAEQMLANFSDMALERRLADPVRNVKNYCIITNTLLRKAAEHGGVHPLYLDDVSSGFAGRIEELNSAVSGYALMKEMAHAYSRLVKRRATRNYSRPVQKAVMHIDENLSGDLSLKGLAELQKINPSYLSTIFKAETGQTVTEYISRQRVRMAIRLLTTSSMQIQTIAQYCGIPDVNYFTKTFKKHMGQTPKQFRQESRQMSRAGGVER